MKKIIGMIALLCLSSGAACQAQIEISPAPAEPGRALFDGAITFSAASAPVYGPAPPPKPADPWITETSAFITPAARSAPVYGPVNPSTTISTGLDLSIPLLLYGPNKTRMWAEFRFHGVDRNGAILWRLAAYGSSP